MQSVDLTHGPIARGVAAFAVPLLLASVVQQLYGTVDFLFVGNVLGTSATAALGVGALLLTLMVGLFSGVAPGVNVKVANLAGKRNVQGVAAGVRTCQWMCLAVAVLMSAVMLSCERWAFGLFGQDEAVIGIGLGIISITFPFYFLYAVLEVQGDAMRGYGHSLVPALVVLANICLLRVVLVVAVVGDMTGIAAAYPVTWATAAVAMAVCRRRFALRSRC